MSNKLTLGTVVIDLPTGYSFSPNWLETNDRTLDGSLITNRTVSSGDIPVSKKSFSFSGVFNFPSTFTGSTGTTPSLEYSGTTYTVHILSENYNPIKGTSTGILMNYSYTLEVE